MSGAQDLPRQLEQARQLARLRQLRERTALAALHEADKTRDAARSRAVDPRMRRLFLLQRP